MLVYNYCLNISLFVIRSPLRKLKLQAKLLATKFRSLNCLQANWPTSSVCHCIPFYWPTARPGWISSASMSKDMNFKSSRPFPGIKSI